MPASRLPRSALAAILVVSILCALGAAAACSQQQPPGLDPPDAGDAGAPTYLEELDSADDYALVQGEKSEVKYLLRVDGREPPAPLSSPCVFQNTERFPYHLHFLLSFPELSALDLDSYVAMVMGRATRVWWGGGLSLWSGVPHPLSGKTGVITYTVYVDAGADQMLSADELAQIYGRLSGCMSYAKELLALLPETPEQSAHLRALESELRGRGIAVVYPEDLIGGLGAEGYSLGEGYGYLRVTPRGAEARDFGPRDVVVAEAAPRDASLLAGLLTVYRQSVHSHTNLRLREKGIVNASVPTIYDNALAASLAGKLVHVVVEETQVSVEPARLEDAQAFWDARRPKLPPLSSDLGVTAVAPLASLGAEDSRAYGAKAANLAELRSILPAEHTVDGFAIPFSAYQSFMRDSGLATQLEALLGDPRLATDAAFRSSGLKQLRDAIRAATLPQSVLDEVHARAAAVFGSGTETTRLRYRSSTNAEDLDVLSGAGLYKSRSGCIADDLDADTAGPSLCLSSAEEAHLRAELDRRLAEQQANPDRYWLAPIIQDLREDLTLEKPTPRAILGVWASLWTERAFEEREYWGIDQRSVYMGIAVNPSFVMEQLEAVAVTELVVDDGLPLYRLVSQLGDVGVVRPSDPTATPETLVFRRGAGDAVDGTEQVVPSSLAPGGARLWSDAQLGELAPLLFTAHDHFATNVYLHLAPFSLDVEIEITEDDRIVLKQARPYLGGM